MNQADQILEREVSAIVNDLNSFFTLSLKHLQKNEQPAFHREIMGRLTRKKERRLAVAAPRGHAKSTICSIAYPLWAALTGRKRFIVLISDSTEKARIIFNNLKAELEDNEYLISIFGRQQSNHWTQDDITLANGCRLIAIGSDKKIRGFLHKGQRPDLIICDDMENDKNIRSATYRENLKNWFWRAVVPALDPMDGDILFIGTMLHMYSLLAAVMGADGWSALHYQAISQDGETLWPARFTKEKLEAIKKEIGQHAFNCEYLNTPIDESTAVFLEQWVNRYDTPPEGLTVSFGIDPAIGTKTHNDYFCIAIVGRDSKTKNLYLLDLYRKRDTVDNHIHSIIGLAKRYEPAKIVIEENAFQAVLRPLIVEAAKQEGIYLPIKGIKNITDKRMRIESLQPIFQRGEMFIRNNMLDFEEELLLYPSVEHDDQLDALEMAIRGFKKSIVCEAI